MKKKVIKFSIKKYSKWCKEHNTPISSWAHKCEDKTVKEWDGINGICEGYIVCSKWVVVCYE